MKYVVDCHNGAYHKKTASTSNIVIKERHVRKKTYLRKKAADTPHMAHHSIRTFFVFSTNIFYVRLLMSPYLPTAVPLSVTRHGLVLIQPSQSFLSSLQLQTVFPFDRTKIYFRERKKNHSYFSELEAVDLVYKEIRY